MFFLTVQMGGKAVCKFKELRNKEVINSKTGQRLGFVCDIEINMHTGAIVAIIVPGRFGFLGIWGRTDDHYIKWSEIKKIGSDIIICEN